MSTDPLIRGSVIATAVFALTAVLGVASTTLRPVAAAVALALFVAGTVGMLLAVLRAAARSRTDAIGIGGLFFLAGSAPDGVRRVLLGSFAAQVVVGLATAIARPYTSAAFGVLAPVAGLAACGLWAARSGSFGPRT